MEKKIDDTEDLDWVTLMYNFLQYSSNYPGTTGSLWFYFNDDLNTLNADIAYNNSNFKSLDYEAKKLGKTLPNGNNGILKNTSIAVPVKILSSLYRSLEMSPINCKVELKRKSTKYCFF